MIVPPPTFAIAISFALAAVILMFEEDVEFDGLDVELDGFEVDEEDALDGTTDGTTGKKNNNKKAPTGYQ